MIRVEGLCKRFGKVQALKEVSAVFARGQVTALVGPNGSGKTTLMKAILGLVRADSGQIEVDGIPVERDPAYRRRIGYMPQLPHYPDNLSVGELLNLISRVRAGGDDALDRPFATDEPLFPLDALLKRKLKGLSGGTLQRIGAELAWRSGAPLLILDEPTAGLDPVASSRMKDRLALDRSRGRTVLISSHILADLQELADDVVFLLEGRVRFQGRVTDLLQQAGEASLERAVASLMREDA